MPLLAFELSQFAANCADVLDTVFGGDVPKHPLTLYQVAARAAVVYLIGLAIVRIGKSRLLSRLTGIDLLLGFILGSLLSRGITGGASISSTAVASAAIVFLHWTLTKLTCHWHGLGTLIKGHAKLVVDDGKPLADALRSSNISEHDLLEELRLHGVSDVSEVKQAYKERNGEISVIRR